MKATGIVRRIDDLGRVVIPKEIRRTLRIREGDPLEIYTEKDGGVIFRKYSPMGDLQDFAAQICESIGKNTGRIAAVADRDSIIALSGAPRRSAPGGAGICAAPCCVPPLSAGRYRFQYFLSSARYCTASARCSGAMTSAPARSAMVRATLHSLS